MKLSVHQINQLNVAIETAFTCLYEKDIFLIENRVHERSIVARFFIYLQDALNRTEFGMYHLDFEYNRYHSDLKRTQDFPNGTFPDIILHKRDDEQHNILIIEFKTWWDPDTKHDIKKINNFINQDEKYKYALGYSIVIEQKRSEVKKTLITNGNKHHV